MILHRLNVAPLDLRGQHKNDANKIIDDIERSFNILRSLITQLPDTVLLENNALPHKTPQMLYNKRISTYISALNEFIDHIDKRDKNVSQKVQSITVIMQEMRNIPSSFDFDNMYKLSQGAISSDISNHNIIKCISSLSIDHSLISTEIDKIIRLIQELSSIYKKLVPE